MPLVVSVMRRKLGFKTLFYSTLKDFTREEKEMYAYKLWISLVNCKIKQSDCVLQAPPGSTHSCKYHIHHFDYFSCV